MKNQTKALISKTKASAEVLARDVAAYEAMRASRPYQIEPGKATPKPPALRLMPAVVSAGTLELRRSKRLGVAA